MSLAYFQTHHVTDVARDLIGKVLVSNENGCYTSGIITETEAYHQKEKACHAYNGLRTPRTEVLYRVGGHAYVYLCYGIHYLFNVTVGRKEEAAAVLIRAIKPLEGTRHMLARRGLDKPVSKLTSGPGNLTKAMGISLKNNDKTLLEKHNLWIESSALMQDHEICTSKRIGVDYAEEDALLPWRYYLKNSRWVSKL